MGVYDILVDDKSALLVSAQVKCYICDFETYKIGDKVPMIHLYGFREKKDNQPESYAIKLPRYNKAKYAIIENRIFMGFTDEEVEMTKINKWGELLLDFLEAKKCLNPHLVEYL